MVLGMHDALVSTSGLIVGLVFAGADQYVTLLTGTIAAVAAAMSMTASQYLADKVDGNSGYALWHGLCTGGTYMFTAGMLLVPFLFIKNAKIALAMSTIVGISIIWFFNFIKSRIIGDSWWPRFLEMLVICSIVTCAAFIISECAKLCFGITI